MFSRRLLGFLKLAVPPKTPATTPDVPRLQGLVLKGPGVPSRHRFTAGDMIADFCIENDRWGYRLRPCTQEEADELNTIDPDGDEHALEALGGIDVRELPIGWVWLALILLSWGIVLGGGYGLYKLLVWIFGGVL